MIDVHGCYFAGSLSASHVFLECTATRSPDCCVLRLILFLFYFVAAGSCCSWASERPRKAALGAYPPSGVRPHHSAGATRQTDVLAELRLFLFSFYFLLF